jgi:lysozyme family protein
LVAWTYEQVKNGYANLWAKATIRPERVSATKVVVQRILKNKARYQAVASIIGCPWWVVGMIHSLEGASNFNTHLHNGDPLTARTVDVPAGRPLTGKPPFTWEESALDALRLEGFDKVPTWEIPRCLFMLEKYNGFGYTSRGVNSPYIWSFTNLYTAGKFVKDGQYSSAAVSQQCGAAAALIVLQQMGEITTTTVVKDDAMSDIKDMLTDFAGFVPVLAKAAASPQLTIANLAVKALAQAINQETKPQTPVAATSVDVKEKLDEAPITDLGNILSVAEQLIQTILPSLEPVPTPTPIVAAAPVAAAPAPAPSVVPSVTTTTTETAPTIPNAVAVNTPYVSPIDTMFGLKGWKTIIGVVLYGLLAIANDSGMVPPAYAWLLVLFQHGAETIIGVGAVAKVDRVIGAFVHSKASTAVTTTTSETTPTSTSH